MSGPKVAHEVLRGLDVTCRQFAARCELAKRLNLPLAALDAPLVRITLQSDALNNL